MSLKDLCAHLGIACLTHYKRRSAFTDVIANINSVIYVHNYTAAAVGLLHGGRYGQYIRPRTNVELKDGYKEFTEVKKPSIDNQSVTTPNSTAW